MQFLQENFTEDELLLILRLSPNLANAFPALIDKLNTLTPVVHMPPGVAFKEAITRAVITNAAKANAAAVPPPSTVASTSSAVGDYKFSHSRRKPSQI